MTPPLISNTGPILALSISGHLELIKHLYGGIWVPDAVDCELRQGGRTGIGLSDYLKANWIEVKHQGKIDPLLLSQLDEGEAAVITLALKSNSKLVLIDERKTRKIARLVYGLNVIGTVRILIDSKKSGMIRNVEEILKIMQENGYWIHDDIIEYALKVAGEK